MQENFGLISRTLNCSDIIHKLAGQALHKSVFGPPEWESPKQSLAQCEALF